MSRNSLDWQVVKPNVPKDFYHSRLRQGFTLIELLVASSIFAMVAILGYATVANTNQVAAYSSLQRSLGESAVFGLEAIAREVRLANGIQAINRGPFIVLDEAGQEVAISDPDGRTSGSQLLVAMTNPLTDQVTIRVIRRMQDDTGRGVVVMENCADPACVIRDSAENLTNSQVNVTDLNFRMLSPSGSPTRQPFLEIGLTLEARDGDKTLTETLKTTVVSRYFTPLRFVSVSG